MTPLVARFTTWRRCCLAALMLLGLISGRALADGQIGAAEVVVNNVTGTMATTHQRAVLRAGVDVFQNETINTADNSASRVLFQDRTQLSIGPMSEVVLDRFVFDPNPSNSAVAVSVAKGVMRFSTGLLPKPDYQIATPSCTIGIRGTVLTAFVSEAKATTVSVQEGQAAVSAQGVTVIVNAGQTTFVAFGKPPSTPTASPAKPPGIATEMDALLQTTPPGQPPGVVPPTPTPTVTQTATVVPLFGNAYVALNVGPTFSSTGKVSNSDLGDNAAATFGNGYQIGAEFGFPAAPGFDLNFAGLYTGGLSPNFTGGIAEEATGSAHAETFLFGAKVWPLQVSAAPAQAPTGWLGLQPYVDAAIGPSVNTMGELTGHAAGIPTGIGPGETKVQFAWRAGAGVELDTGIPGLSAGIGYDYLRLGNFSSTDTFNLYTGLSITRPAFNVNVAENVLKLNVTWHFGTAP